MDAVFITTPVTLEVTPGVPHVFQGFAAMLDTADAALTRAGSFIREHLLSGAACPNAAPVDPDGREPQLPAP